MRRAIAPAPALAAPILWQGESGHGAGMLRVVDDTDRLPLTCTRAGTCCHGKQVWINPWELAALAQARNCLAAEFLAAHTDDGGIRLRFSGEDRWRGQRACDQYDAASAGCRAYAGRPLACRLFPLGLRRQGAQRSYVHEGAALPCLDACPEVRALPEMTVAAYLAGQDIAAALRAQDDYLELVTGLGDAAFAIVVDTGVIARQRAAIHAAWLAVASERPSVRAQRLGEWLPRVLVPELGVDAADARLFVAAHRELLQTQMQRAFAALDQRDQLLAASSTCVRMAAHLAQGCAGDAQAMITTWARRLNAL